MKLVLKLCTKLVLRLCTKFVLRLCTVSDSFNFLILSRQKKTSTSENEQQIKHHLNFESHNGQRV